MKILITERQLGLLEEQESNQSNKYLFSNKKETDGYITFVNIDRPFKPQSGEKVILVNKNNPSDTSEFIFGKNIFQSKYRSNEAYSKKSVNLIQNSKFIRDCIKEAFPMGEYEWQEDDDTHTEGLRGVYPLSREDNWSALNFFDTNPHRKNKLYELFLKSGESDQKEWLVNFLKGDSNELRYMINQQRLAIEKSDKSEVDAISLITDDYTLSQTKGLKTDRYSGIDAIDNKTKETHQIKNVQSVSEKVDEDGVIHWEVAGKFSRLKDYKNKSELDNLTYYIPEEKTSYVFKNKNYDVINNDLAIHFEKPKVYR